MVFTPAVLAIVLLPCLLPRAQDAPPPVARPLNVDDALDLARIGDVAMSPDGAWVFYTERRVNWEDNDSDTTYHLVSSEGGTAVPFVGEAGGSNFAFSPDGRFLSFLREVDDDDQVMLLPVDGGEARVLTDHEGGVNEFRWSPDGRLVVFTAEEPRSADAQAAWDAGGDAIFVGEGANGLRAERWTNLWSYDLAAKEEKRLTELELTILSFDVAPDGERVVFSGSKDNRTNYDHLSELYIVDARDGEVTQLTENTAPEGGPRWSPDGTRIAYNAPDADWFDLQHGSVWILDVATGKARPLPAEYQGSPRGLTWSTDGASLLFTERRGVDTNLYRMDAATGKTAAVTSVAGTLRPRAFSRDQTRMVYSFDDFSHSSDLYAADLTASKPIRLTRSNPQIEERALGVGSTVRWRSKDGREIEGVLVLPPGHREGDRHPLMMCIHGGPPGAYGNTFDPEFHVFAGLGYAVFGPNPRGSSSYGDEHLRALMGDIGRGEYDDLMSGVDHLIEAGIVDPDRLGLRGWSWGGILGAWTTTQTDRFRAASLGAMVGDWWAETGGGLMSDLRLHYFESEPWENPEEWRRGSALTHVANVTTPTILLHGERDGVSTVNQSMMWYTALRARDVPVRFVKFPRQGHGIREPRLRRICDVEEIRWLQKYVQGVEWEPPTRAEAKAPTRYGGDL